MSGWHEADYSAPAKIALERQLDDNNNLFFAYTPSVSDNRRKIYWNVFYLNIHYETLVPHYCSSIASSSLMLISQRKSLGECACSTCMCYSENLLLIGLNTILGQKKTWNRSYVLVGEQVSWRVEVSRTSLRAEITVILDNSYRHGEGVSQVISLRFLIFQLLFSWQCYLRLYEDSSQN